MEAQVSTEPVDSVTSMVMSVGTIRSGSEMSMIFMSCSLSSPLESWVTICPVHQLKTSQVRTILKVFPQFINVGSEWGRVGQIWISSVLAAREENIVGENDLLVVRRDFQNLRTGRFIPIVIRGHPFFGDGHARADVAIVHLDACLGDQWVNRTVVVHRWMGIIVYVGIA